MENVDNGRYAEMRKSNKPLDDVFILFPRLLANRTYWKMTPAMNCQIPTQCRGDNHRKVSSLKMNLPVLHFNQTPFGL